MKNTLVTTVNGRDLIGLGYKEGKSIGMALAIANGNWYVEKTIKLRVLRDVLVKPESYVNQGDAIAELAKELMPKIPEATRIISLLEKVNPYNVYGKDNIEKGAYDQMDIAMRLPVTVGGALMPDAHQGYGLPIGGVLATENAVIPYGVGVDIGCRMALTIYDEPVSIIKGQHKRLKNILDDNTRFGAGNGFDKVLDHEVLARPEFKDIEILRKLYDRAANQIGSSGSGNHFVEFGIVKITDPQNEFNLPLGEYMGILSHSGSRGLGANVASHYTKLAKELNPLPDEARHLSWLNLEHEAGEEYWIAMNLAGDYAKACHDQIHYRIAKELGWRALAKIENHHNFAWKEKLENGKEVIVHRKGATPAGKGVFGIIPGSMATPGFIVRGKGSFDSINSASHGAGRVLSRTKAKSTISKSAMRKFLSMHGVTLIGGGLDESPQAYKDIMTVMDAQRELVDVVGSFMPKIVKMDAGDDSNSKDGE